VTSCTVAAAHTYRWAALSLFSVLDHIVKESYPNISFARLGGTTIAPSTHLISPGKRTIPQWQQVAKVRLAVMVLFVYN